MEKFTEDVRDLHERVARLDELLTTDIRVSDLREKRADAAHEVAERNHNMIRRLFLAGLVVALVWTPLTAYGAVWMHERIRNHCYPGVLMELMPPPESEPWYCDLFPGTGRGHDEGAEDGPAE